MYHILPKLILYLMVLLVLFSCVEDRKSSSYEAIDNDFSAETFSFKNDTIAARFAIANVDKNLPDSLDSDLIKYGFKVLSSTSKYVGPEAKDTSKRYAGNNLDCVSCHLLGGAKAYGGSWIGVMDRYPTFRSKNGKVNDIYMRIDGCFHRSMNGISLPKDSKEMKGIVEYFKWLSSDTLINKMPQYKGYLKISPPDREADTIHGKYLYNNYCFVCHGTDGKGVLSNKYNVSQGYIYPQLWGEDTYNIGAGMAKLETFAGFIKANMPYGVEFNKPQLTDEEAYDIAGYVNMQKRPVPPGLDKDFPDKTKKGADVPYGPYIDSFPPIQHRIGPFQPIKDYYKSLKNNIDSTKTESKPSDH